MHTPSGGRLLLALLALWASGCRDQPAVRTYEIPKSPSPVASSAASPAAGEPSRMLAAMLQGDRQAWFFKVMGPEDQVQAVADEVGEFFDSLGYDATSSRPTWKRPDGWTEDPQSGMRLATLRLPVEQEVLELSVIGLPLVGDWQTQVADNANRWRGQLGLDALTEQQQQALESRKLGERQLVLVDFAGQSAPGAMMSRPAAPRLKQPIAGADSAPSNRAVPPTPQNRQPLTYDLPDGWRELSPTSMRVVNLSVGDPSASASLTGFAFSAAAPQMADPLANVNRWRNQLELPAIDQSELDQTSEKIEIDGIQATYIPIVPADGAEHTLAAMGERDGQVWFFKLSGPAETVTQQTATFRRWLASIRFSE